MKAIFLFAVFGVVAVIGDVAPYPPSGWKPQRALLVLPPNNNQPSQSDSPPQPAQDETESLDKVNESVMERLRQETGSDTGSYYVYLPDGRLQKVQYTTAPVKQQDVQQNYDPNNFQQQYPDPRNYQQTYNQYRQGSAQPAPNTPQGNQQSNHQLVFGTNKHSNQANQQQYNRYQSQQQFGESREQQQYAQYQRDQFSAQQKQQNSDNKEAESGDPSKLLAKYNQEQPQNLTPTSYIASVQFTDVPPVTGPIFAYSPSPLVRVVRYANNYY